MATLFFGHYSYRANKGAVLSHTQNQIQPFYVEMKKEIISCQKPFILSKYNQNVICLGWIYITFFDKKGHFYSS